MKEELRNYLKIEHPQEGSIKNGYYQRDLTTRYGKIERLNVPRDRVGEFHTELFEPYKRIESWLEQAIISMYKSG